MRLSEEEIGQMMDRLDLGDDENIPDEIKKDHQRIKNGIQFIHEEDFKKRLKKAEKSVRKSSFFDFKFYATSGVAACLALALFWHIGYDSSKETIELQIEEVPIYSDSATYDSLKTNIPEVEKREENKISQ